MVNDSDEKKDAEVEDEYDVNYVDSGTAFFHLNQIYFYKPIPSTFVQIGICL